LVGLNDWSILVMKFLKSQAPERWRVIALLDEDARWIGRSVDGAQVFGPPAQLEAVIEEFATHGVRTDRVVVGGAAAGLSEKALAEVKAVCARRNLEFVLVPRLVGLEAPDSTAHPAERDVDRPPPGRSPRDLPPSPPYLHWKRLMDAVAAALLIFSLLPLLAIAAIVVILDVGLPILFWQQRIGRNGRELQIYKLRTLRPPFDRTGRKIPEEQRLSWIGRILRQTRIDELPQLLNVLIGDMSLIGPRPLLPQDQPPNRTLRLTIRPGITGWAQVNGGAGLSPTEKEALDVWYICHACLSLDLHILGMTVLSLLRGDRRSETALAQAQSFHARRPQPVQTGRDRHGSGQAAARRFPTAPARDDDREAVAAMQSR
jgi:lipopolysaccharide/colanic/teichoic acid biosynthesis glycosyltransferase